MVFDILTSESLNQQPAASYNGLSYINADGLPFQWSLCLDGGVRTVRFLCEAGTPGLSIETRTELSFELLRRILAETSVPEPSWFYETLSPLVLPRREEWPSHWRSAIWFGVGASTKGIQIKPYFNFNRGTLLERWQRIGWVLKSLGQEEALRLLCDISRHVSADSWPVALAVDIQQTGEPGRLKIYFRSGEVGPDWLKNWYASLGAEAENPIIRSVMDSFPFSDQKRYPDRTFFLSLEFHLKDGSASLKTDVNITRWINSDAEATVGILKLMRGLSLDEAELISGLKALAVWPPDRLKMKTFRLVGVGYEPDSTRHVNVYIEPPVTPTFQQRSSRITKGKVSAAIRKGLSYLLESCTQLYWSDYILPVGVSDRWVSAFVLLHLSELHPEFIMDEARKKIHNVCEWLLQERKTGTGWGYNETTDCDADTSSLAVLALERWGFQAPEEARSVILNCFTENGGFATYSPGSIPQASWTQGTADVSSLAIATLENRITEDKKAAVIKFIEAAQRNDGLFNSFWWFTPLYPTWAVLNWTLIDGILLNRQKMADSLAAYTPFGAFETALLILCRKQLSIITGQGKLIRNLIDDQRADGSWKPSAYLRLTNPLITEPWKEIDSGKLFVDQNAFMSTAVVLNALSKYSI